MRQQESVLEIAAMVLLLAAILAGLVRVFMKWRRGDFARSYRKAAWVLGIAILIGIGGPAYLIFIEEPARMAREQELLREYAAVPLSERPKPGERRCEYTGRSGDEPRCPRRATWSVRVKGIGTEEHYYCGVHCMGGQCR